MVVVLIGQGRRLGRGGGRDAALGRGRGGIPASLASPSPDAGAITGPDAIVGKSISIWKSDAGSSSEADEEDASDGAC
ncbi:hypothetical protein BW11_02680 [Bifidobacterium sp. UTCIF-38]|nr:hypothetical protein BW11_02680 [Bifidobacterium sp. UTCIF-38]